MYVLTTKEKNYFVEYLLEHLVLSDSISEAMVFEENELITAQRFQQMLLEHCHIFFPLILLLINYLKIIHNIKKLFYDFIST